MSTTPVDEPRPAEAVAGFLAALSLTASVLALFYRPVRLAPFAILIAIVAAGIGGRHARLAAFASAVATLAFFAGMTIAAITSHPLY